MLNARKRVHRVLKPDLPPSTHAFATLLSRFDGSFSLHNFLHYMIAGTPDPFSGFAPTSAMSPTSFSSPSSLSSASSLVASPCTMYLLRVITALFILCLLPSQCGAWSSSFLPVVRVRLLSGCLEAFARRPVFLTTSPNSHSVRHASLMNLPVYLVLCHEWLLIIHILHSTASLVRAAPPRGELRTSLAHCV